MNDNRYYQITKPHEIGELRVSGSHTLYWEQRGNVNGVPIVLLHGGPGSGSNPASTCLFNPKHYRIVSFDQRGCGKSQPQGSTKENNLDRLIKDVNALRQHLGITQWIVYGSSWGSTLSLAYGARYPESCLGFILRSVFLCRQREINWWLYDMRSVFPEYWENFVQLIPVAKRNDLLAAYKRLLNNPATALEAAIAWKTYDIACSSFLPGPQFEVNDAQSTIAAVRIHHHYFANSFFTDNIRLLQGVKRIRHLPLSIIHGRYDMICPAANAYDLAACWDTDNVELEIITEAGHSARISQTLNVAVFVAAERMIQRINV